MNKTYIGILVTFLGYLFQTAGVPFVASEAEATVAFITALVGAIFALYGRFKAGGIVWFGARK